MSRLPWILFLAFPLFAQNQSPDTRALTGRIRALNESIAANRENTANLAVQREQLLYELIAASPRDAIDLASPSSWTGSIEVIVGDDFATGTSYTTHILRTADASTELYFPAAAPKSSILSATIEGVQIRDRIAVSSLTPRDALPMSCSLTGPQRTAVVMVTTPDNPNFPEGMTPSYLNQAVFGGPNTFQLATTLANYIHETSYGQTSVTGTVFGPYRLPQTPAYCNSPDYINGAIAAASKDAPLDEYTRYIVFFPASTCQTSSGSNVSGFGTIGCPLQNSPLGTFVSSKSWIPVRPFHRVGAGGEFSLQQILTHEYGHNLGLQHAHSERFPGEPLGPLGSQGTRSEYGDVFDVMGSTYAGQFSAAHKSLDLGWLRPSEFATVTESGSFNLLPLETSSGLRGLRIRRDAATNSWLWVEYRQPIGEADRQFGPATEPIFNGASIRYEAPDAVNVDQRSDTYLLDFTPATPTIFDSALAVGKTWTDPYSPLRLTVNSADGKQLSLGVAYDTPCATAKRLPVPIPYPGSTNLLEITAPDDCAWTATSRSPWITLAGPTSGSGNGTVLFSVATNLNPVQRLGGITLDRQTVRVVQESSNRPTVVSMTPFQGAGQEGIFTFRFTNAEGATTTDRNLIDFAQGNRSVCRFYLFPGGLAGFPNGGGNISLSVPGNTAVTSGCTISSVASSYVASATETIFTIRIAFHEPGTYRIWGQTGSARDVSSSTLFPLGQWDVPGCTASADVTTFTVPFSGSTGTGQVSADPACRWTAVGNAPWILTTSGSLGDGTLQFTAAPNPSAQERTGTIQISNQTLRITQAGSPSSTISSVNTVWGSPQFLRTPGSK